MGIIVALAHERNGSIPAFRRQQNRYGRAAYRDDGTFGRLERNAPQHKEKPVRNNHLLSYLRTFFRIRSNGKADRFYRCGNVWAFDRRFLAQYGGCSRRRTDNTRSDGNFAATQCCRIYGSRTGKSDYCNLNFDCFAWSFLCHQEKKVGKS